jgi:tRNA 2-thiouridine synthesizing protein A
MTTYHVNAKHLLCPMPVIKLQEQIASAQVGDVVELMCTDAGSLHDVPAWCRVHQHTVLSMDTQDSLMVFRIQVNADF